MPFEIFTGSPQNGRPLPPRWYLWTMAFVGLAGLGLAAVALFTQPTAGQVLAAVIWGNTIAFLAWLRAIRDPQPPPPPPVSVVVPPPAPPAQGSGPGGIILPPGPH